MSVSKIAENTNLQRNNYTQRRSDQDRHNQLKLTL
jgi:hypothetical protein